MASGKRGAEIGSGEAAARGILHGPLYFAFGLCLGVIGYFSLGFEPGIAPASGVGLTGLVLGILLRRLHGVRVLAVAGLLSMGAGAGLIIVKLHAAIRPAPSVTTTIGPTMVEGWVTAVEPGAKGVRLRLRVHAIAGEPRENMPRTIRLTHVLEPNVSPGRFVRCWAVIRPPPQPGLPGDYDFARQAFFEGLNGVGYVQGRCRGGAVGVPPGFREGAALSIAETRRALGAHVDREAGERAGGFAAALTSGDRSLMDQRDIEALRNSGLAHLLAISGLHLGIVGGLVYLAIRRVFSLWEWAALRFPPQKPAAVAAIVATGTYMILSGMSISTQRAFIMAAIFFGAILLDRAPLSIRSFSVAMIAVILLQPHSVMSPGFQMSFAATGALIATYEAWGRMRARNGQAASAGTGFMVKSLVVSSFVGAAATAPFALYHFDRLAPFGLAANLLAMPIVTFISAPAAGLAIVAAPFGLSGPFLRAFGWSLERVLDVAHWAAGAGGNGISTGVAMPALVLMVLTGGLVALCLSRRSLWRAASAGGALAGAGLVWTGSPQLIAHWSASGDIYVREAGGGMQAVSLADGDGLGPLQFSETPVGRDCSDAPCRIETPLGRLLAGTAAELSRTCGEDVAVVLSLGHPDPDCWRNVEIIEWETARQTNGASLFRPALGSSYVSGQTCGTRPWNPCAGEPDQS